MQSRIGTVWHDLANAIVYQAVEDYRRALRGGTYNGKPPETNIQAIEKFFHSEYYQILTSVNSDYLLSKLREEYREECNRRGENV